MSGLYDTKLDHVPVVAILGQTPGDVQELEYVPPGHSLKDVHSSLGMATPMAVSDPEGLRQAAELLNGGIKVA